jgi:hypothetical protein
MMEYPDLDFSYDIIDASWNFYSYDSLEGSRAVYLFDLIELSQQKEKIKREILRALSILRIGSCAYDQLFDLIGLFAKQGDKESRKFIYKKFNTKTYKSLEFIGEEVIIGLDGIEGLKYVAEIKGKIFEQEPDEDETRYMIDFFQKDNPNLNVYEELEKAAVNNKYIRIYLDLVYKQDYSKLDNKRQFYNYDTVNDLIVTDYIVPLHPNHSEDLIDSDIKKLADDFLKTKSRNKQEKYMRIFDLVKYPYDYKDLLIQAKRPYSRKDRLIEYAVNSLRYFSGSDIRELAIDKLVNNTKKHEIYTNLLIANYQDGDGAILKEIVDKAIGEEKIHKLSISYVEIYQANKTPDCIEPLLALYDKLTCGFHRGNIVEILIENNVLPDKIWNEIQYDSMSLVRDLVKKKKSVIG